MGNFVSITLGESSRGTLGWFFKQKQTDYNGSIKMFKEDLSIGPLHDLDNHIDERKRFFYELFEKTGNIDILGEEYIEKSISESYGLIKDWENDVNFIIWYGNNVKDQLALRFLVTKLRKYNIYEVNVSEIIEKSIQNIMYRVKSVGECGLLDLEKAIVHVKYMEDIKKDILQGDWNRILEEEYKLRIWKDGGVLGVEDDYYDSMIIENTSSDFEKTARIIGRVMVESNQVVSEFFIDYRIRKLINNGTLEYQGNLRQMKDFEIRRR